VDLTQRHRDTEISAERAHGRVGPRSDTDHGNFATGSSYEPFHVEPAAREDRRLLANSRRHHAGINHVGRSWVNTTSLWRIYRANVVFPRNSSRRIDPVIRERKVDPP
jgi:hypothetical protein